MAGKGKKKKRILFAIEIIVLLLFIGGLYVYGQISARMDKLVKNKVTESSGEQATEHMHCSVLTTDLRMLLWVLRTAIP